MTEAKPLTANSTIGEWLTDPAGGPLVRGLLAQTGASEEMLAPIKGLPLQQLVALSQGQLPQSVLDALRGDASGNAYTVSKHGVIGLTRSAAFMYGPQGIRVNAVAPGGVATGIPMPPNMSQVGSARLAPFQQQIPTIATAEQVAASITFPLSDDGININGAILPSDGGWSVQ